MKRMMFLALFVAMRLAAAERISFELVDNRILIPVAINGSGPFRLILDTGAPGLTLSEEVAARLGLPNLATTSSSGVGEAVVRSVRSRVQSVVIRGHNVGAMSCSVMSFADPALWGTERVDGILGLPVFETWAVTIDYRKREIVLAEDASGVSAGAIRVSIDFAGHIPVVTASVLGSNARLGVDTGMRSSLLLATTFVKQHRLGEHLQTTPAMITGWGIGGPVRSRLARLPKLDLGPVSFRSVVARLST